MRGSGASAALPFVAAPPRGLHGSDDLRALLGLGDLPVSSVERARRMGFALVRAKRLSCGRPHLRYREGELLLDLEEGPAFVAYLEGDAREVTMSTFTPLARVPLLGLSRLLRSPVVEPGLVLGYGRLRPGSRHGVTSSCSARDGTLLLTEAGRYDLAELVAEATLGAPGEVLVVSVPPARRIA